MTRRTLAATGAGLAAGIFAAPFARSAAQGEATPVAPIPQGFVSTRLRTLANPENRDEITELVRTSFAVDVRELAGYRGYLLANADASDDQQVSVVVFEEERQTAAFDALAADFVASIEDLSGTVGTEQWAGDLLMHAGPAAGAATPAASPSGAGEGAFVALRIHTSKPGTDPRDFVPLATSGFLPIVTGLQGFLGYLWYPIDGGFVAISVFDSAESAAASNDAARVWAVEYLPDYTDGDPRVIDGTVVYADLPIFSE